MARAAWLLLLALCGPASAAVLHGVVTHVTDGDTVWVRPAAGGRAIELRLLDLDAPEGCQRFGPEAKKALAQRLHRQRVRVTTRGEDDYGRTLARLQHRREDVGAWLVREGYAWSASFQGRPGPYMKLQQQAQRAQRGLWSLPGAVDPRSFRRLYGQCG
ncbi:MAG: thermonuclease family protein [Ramlibacter sp.]|jgi:endonuclease YncB( thermonuclease family)